MAHIIWDIESFSKVNLKASGAHIYAADPSTSVHFFCYAVEDGDVETWRPGDTVRNRSPIPPAISSSRIIGHSRTRSFIAYWSRYGFVPIPWENQDCVMRLALASAYPAELGLCCTALGLPYKKDPAARAAMLRLSKPSPKKLTPEKAEQWARDLVLLHERCKTDVEAARAVYDSPRLQSLLPAERDLLVLDARINETGICANVPFLNVYAISL
jgi:hypothetical protein